MSEVGDLAMLGSHRILVGTYKSSRLNIHDTSTNPVRKSLGRARSRQPTDRLPLLYIDLHLVHEVTSPQAFDGLRVAGRRVRQPKRTVATVDHNIPTEPRGTPITDPIAAQQIEALQKNCKEFGVPLFDMDSPDQGIVHVIGPELGLTQPGMTIVCGDSHTSTHGAFGALAFGIGTSEVEHVLATQCLPQSKPKTMLMNVRGSSPKV